MRLALIAAAATILAGCAVPTTDELIHQPPYLTLNTSWGPEQVRNCLMNSSPTGIATLPHDKGWLLINGRSWAVQIDPTDHGSVVEVRRFEGALTQISYDNGVKPCLDALPKV